MSRELKFRIWNIVLKKYVCPNVVEQKDGLWLNLGNEDNLYEFEQYTGLKDKNGKEIYEGDIVKYNAYYEGDEEKGTGEVNFGYLEDTDGWTNSEYLCWRVDNWLSLDYGGEWIEVIGNIHENPELLGGRK